MMVVTKKQKSNLIYLNERDREEHLTICRKGGSSRSPKKSDSAKWRHIKERIKSEGIVSKDAEWLMEKLENRDAMSGEILLQLEKSKKNIKPTEMLTYTNMLIQAGKFIHGEKSKVDISSVNLNIDTTKEEVQEHLKKILGDRLGVE